jgi:predicted fused transcriptional regulator/phosphomethylpyrimidine kinase
VLPACFHLADTVFPRVRGEAARSLVAQGWSQSKAAEAVGVSQVMVSKYVQRQAETDQVVLHLAGDLVASSIARAPTDGSWCDAVRAAQDTAGDEALQDLLAAQAMLQAAPPLKVVPQIGLNIARAPAGAATTDQVLAFPARLVAAGHQLVCPSPPAPGGSRHLAAGLLKMQAAGGTNSAAANVLATAQAVAAVHKLGWKIRDLPPGTDPDSRFLAAIDGKTKVFHDAGALGIEPCLYIAGADALSVAKDILQLHEEMT